MSVALPFACYFQINRRKRCWRRVVYKQRH